MEAAEVPYELEQVSLYGSGGKPSWFMKLNPRGQVPVLVVKDDNDTDKVVLADSDLILDEMGMVMLFAGVQKEDPTKLHAIMKFPDMEAFQAFGSNEELTEERKKAGAVVESGVMTMISEDDFFTNFPEPFLSD